MRVAGIDYGKKGAVAILDTDGDGPPAILQLIDFYDDFDGLIDVMKFRKMLVERRVHRVYLEDFLVRYKSAPHILSLRNHERIRVACQLALGPHHVEVIQAQTWKRRLGLYGKKDKAASIELAVEVFGVTFKRDDEAEAALIAHFGAMEEGEA